MSLELKLLVFCVIDESLSNIKAAVINGDLDVEFFEEKWEELCAALRVEQIKKLKSDDKIIRFWLKKNEKIGDEDVRTTGSS